MLSVRIRNLSKRHFQSNFSVYFILTICFILGIIVGAFLINRLNYEESLKFANYFSWIFEYIQVGNSKSINIFKSSLFSNTKMILIIWFSSLISIGVLIIPLIVSLKGITIGVTVGFLVKKFGMKGFIFASSGLLPHYLIIIPGFLAIGALGITHSLYSTKNKKGKVNNNMIDYSILILLFFIIIILGVLIEGFFTPYLLNLIQFKL